MNPEPPETACPIAPVGADAVADPGATASPLAEAAAEPAEGTSAIRHRGFLICMTVLIVLLPLALVLLNVLWIGPAFTNDGFSRNWVQRDMEDYLNGADIVERAVVLHDGDFLNGYHFTVEATLVPGVSDEQVCQLLVQADTRFGGQTKRGIGLTTIYVDLHGGVPSVTGTLRTTVPFDNYPDGFTIHNGKGVCARTLRPGPGGCPAPGARPAPPPAVSQSGLAASAVGVGSIRAPLARP